MQAGFINAPHTVDYLANLHLAVERSFSSGPFSSVEFGVAHSTRNKSYHIDQSFLTLGGGTLSGGSAVETAPFAGNSCSPLSWMGVGAQTCYNPLDLIRDGTLQERTHLRLVTGDAAELEGAREDIHPVPAVQPGHFGWRCQPARQLRRSGAAHLAAMRPANAWHRAARSRATRSR